MTQSISPLTGEVVAWQRPADQLRARADARYDQTRSNGSLSNDARLAFLAQTYQWLCAQMATLQQQGTADTASYQANVKRSLYGIDDLTSGASPADRAGMSMSFRDAQARVADTDVSQLMPLLDQANATGDELLARAVGNRALDTPMGLGDVIDAYLSTRPAKADAWTRYQQANAPQSIADLWEYVTPIPPELSATPAYKIQQLAASADDLRAQANAV